MLETAERSSSLSRLFRLFIVSVILVSVSACDLFDSILSNVQTTTQQYGLTWGINSIGDPNYYEQQADTNPASPKHETIIEVTVWSGEPLDLGGDDADLTITAVLTSWGNHREEYPVVLKRVAFTWPPGIAQGGLITDPSSPSEPLYAYKYFGSLSRKCPECVGDFGQSQPAYWRLTARRTAGMRIHGTYSIEIAPYMGPILN